MASSTTGPRKTYVQGASLVGKQFYIVRTQVKGQVTLASAATQKLVGTLLSAPEKAGELVAVWLRNGSGTSKVILGGTVALGDALTSDANGKAIATTTTNDEVLGYAEEAGVVNQIIEYTSVSRKY